MADRFVLLFECPLTPEDALLNPYPAPGIIDRKPKLFADLCDGRDLAGPENPATRFQYTGFRLSAPML
jgi:hypothetical protein